VDEAVILFGQTQEAEQFLQRMSGGANEYRRAFPESVSWIGADR